MSGNIRIRTASVKCLVDGYGRYMPSEHVTPLQSNGCIDTDISVEHHATVPERLGEKVRRIRKRRGWTQIQLAEKAGVDKETISNLEAGKNSRLSTIEAVAIAFGENSQYLVTGETFNLEDGTDPLLITEVDEPEATELPVNRDVDPARHRPDQPSSFQQKEGGRGVPVSGQPDSSSGTRFENRLAGLVAYVRSLTGKEREDFIVAAVAVLAALRQPRAEGSDRAVANNEG